MDVNLQKQSKSTWNEPLSKLGPLAPLVGVWHGDKGDDIAPSDDRGTENNKYREQMIFEPIGPANNHEQGIVAPEHRNS